MAQVFNRNQKERRDSSGYVTRPQRIRCGSSKMTENFKDEFEDENITCDINKANRIQEDTMKWSFRKD